jgi:uncharacterized protein (TIGR00290 family)
MIDMTIAPQKILLAWSGGKDSAMALWQLQQDTQFEVVALLTTGNEEMQRISMHGVRLDLARQQAASIGLPLLEMLVSDATYAGYEQKMGELLAEAIITYGIQGVAFGDIFLADLRKYREEQLARLSLKAYFPLWGADTEAQLHTFWKAGFETILCCVNDGYLGEAFVGQALTASLRAAFPADVDPCGENGEYHTFCYAGPIFRDAIPFRTGEKVYKPLDPAYITPDSKTRGFWYVDLV